MKRGLLTYVPNDANRPSEARGYYAVLVWDTDLNEWQNLLMTEHELGEIRPRAQKNPEDTPRPTWLDVLLRALGL